MPLRLWMCTTVINMVKCLFVCIYLFFCCSTYHRPKPARGHCHCHQISLDSFTWYLFQIFLFVKILTVFLASVCTLSSHQPAMFGSPSPSPTPILNAPPLTPIPPVPSQSTSSWGPMMTPGEVKELLVPHPQIGEYYVVTKGRRPGVYLTWWVSYS